MRWVEEHWGTHIIIEVPGGAPTDLFDELRAWFDRVDELFSPWRADSEVRRLADGTLAAQAVSSEVRAVLATCDELRVHTGGAFDIRAGGHPAATSAPGRAPIDPSGYVKGWAVGRAGERLVRAGLERFWISAGGDVLVRDGGPARTPWRIGIQHPWEPDRLAAVIGLESGAVATSGRYERGDHVLDPRTGQPASGLMSVTVVGTDLGLVDAYATAAVARGDGGMDWLATLPGVAAMGITDDRQVLTTPGFDALRIEGP